MFAEGTFLLALGCIFAAGCILALWLEWPPRLFIWNSALLTLLAGLPGLLVVRVVLLAALVLLIRALSKDFLPSQRNYLNRLSFPLMTILPRKGLLAIAVVVDVALQTDGRPISAKSLATHHGLPPRHLDSVLRSLARDGILKGIRGPHGGYELARERRCVTANDILRAADTVHEAGKEPNSELVVKVVLPVLSAAEQEFGLALSRISLDDMIHRAASMAMERVATKAA